MRQLLAALLLLCTSCHHEPDHADLAFDAMGSYAREVRKKYGFELCSIGGSMMEEIEIFHMSFTRKDKGTIDKARQLIVKMTQEFIDKINADETIRPYLHDFPVTSENVNISLCFEATKKEPPGNPFVYFVFSKKGTIFYGSYDNSIPPGHQHIVSLCDEPYNEALRIVKGSSL